MRAGPNPSLVRRFWSGFRGDLVAGDRASSEPSVVMCRPDLISSCVRCRNLPCPQDFPLSIANPGDEPQIRPTSGQFWPSLATNWSALGQIRPCFVKFGLASGAQKSLQKCPRAHLSGIFPGSVPCPVWRGAFFEHLFVTPTVRRGQHLCIGPPP